MSNTLSPQNRIHSSKRSRFALSVATSLAFLAVAVLSLVLIGSDTAYASFNPVGVASLSNSAPGANTNIRTEFNLPAPNVNFSSLIAFTPTDFFVATDADITNGHGVAFLKAGVSLGLINGPCFSSGVVAEFQMMDATTDISGPTVVFEDDGDLGITFEIHEGENTDSWATAAELPKGAALYPDFLLRIFTDENGQTLQPRTRLYGQTQVVANNVSLNFVFFQPGTTFKNPTTGQVFTTDAALGYPSFTILQDLGDPDVKPNPDSTITDFCTPLDTIITTCGVAQETRSLMNRDNHCPSVSGTPTRTNPTSDKTLNFVTFTAGLPDADGDGFENSFDTCPYLINEENGRAAAIRDSDGIDPVCDRDPDEWCGNEPDAFSLATKFGQDCDKDGFVNAADNCPLIANPEQGKADADSDGIGDACDRDSTTAEGGRPIVALVMPVDIGGGGTPCFTAVEATLDYIRAIDNLCADSGDGDGDGGDGDGGDDGGGTATLPTEEEQQQRAKEELLKSLAVGMNISAGLATVPLGGSTPVVATCAEEQDGLQPVAGVEVTFKIDSQPGSDANLDGQAEVTVTSDAEGFAEAALNVGSTGGDIVVSATGKDCGPAKTVTVTAGIVASETAGPAGGADTGVGSLAPLASSIPTWAAIVSALGGAGLLGSLGAFASRIFRRRR